MLLRVLRYKKLKRGVFGFWGWSIEFHFKFWNKQNDVAHKILHYNHTPLLSFKCTSPTHKSIFLHFYKREQKEDWIHMAENNWFHLLENTWTCKGSQAISATITVAFRPQHTNMSPERLMKGTLQLPSWDWVRQAGQENPPCKWASQAILITCVRVTSWLCDWEKQEFRFRLWFDFYNQVLKISFPLGLLFAPSYKM